MVHDSWFPAATVYSLKKLDAQLYHVSIYWHFYIKDRIHWAAELNDCVLFLSWTYFTFNVIVDHEHFVLLDIVKENKKECGIVSIIHRVLLYVISGMLLYL